MDTKYTETPRTLMEWLKAEKASNLPGRIYHRLQVEFTCNSNRIEGNRLDLDQVRSLFETNSIATEKGQVICVDDLIETVNHFRCIDSVIDHAEDPLSEKFIKQLQAALKTGTADSRRRWFAVGGYKRLPNEVGGRETTAPGDVAAQMKGLLLEYNQTIGKTLEELLDFHCRFERIHPFQDGNGRVGRLVLFKECLRNGIVPFIIRDELKMFYYRGLQEWERVPGFLLDTCLSAQDEFGKYMDYFGIAR